MKRLFYPLLFMLGIIAISVTSCKKENQSDEQDLTSVEESAVANETFVDAFADMSSLAAENDGLFSVAGSDDQIRNAPVVISNSCGEASISPLNNTWPKTLTLDFGDGCTMENVTRKGKIIAVFTDRFKNTGAKITVTFENFYVNDHKIEGSTVIVNNGKNAAGNFNYTVEVSKSKISSSGKEFSFSSVKNIEWVEGSGTRTPGDDVFSITGSASGTNSNGKEFSIAIVKPLIKKVACRFIVAGSTDIKTGSSATRTLDYGTGDCDNKASVTVEGVTKEITLRK